MKVIQSGSGLKETLKVMKRTKLPDWVLMQRDHTVLHIES
jgi:hypothetical protein